MSKYIIEAKNLKKYFPIKGGLLSKIVGYVKAVDDVTLSIKERGLSWSCRRVWMWKNYLWENYSQADRGR